MSDRKERAVNGFRTFGYNQIGMIQHFIALLWSFAELAERSAAAPAPVRLSLLVLFRLAEPAARRFTARAALGVGMHLDEDLLVPLADGSGIDAAISLADQFVVLAQALETILYCLTGLAQPDEWRAGPDKQPGLQVQIGRIARQSSGETHRIVRASSSARAPPARESLTISI